MTSHCVAMDYCTWSLTLLIDWPDWPTSVVDFFSVLICDCDLYKWLHYLQGIHHSIHAHTPTHTAIGEHSTLAFPSLLFMLFHWLTLHTVWWQWCTCIIYWKLAKKTTWHPGVSAWPNSHYCISLCLIPAWMLRSSVFCKFSSISVISTLSENL